MSRADKLMDKIRQEKIKPLPRWRFVLRKGLAATLFAGSVVIGAIAFSVILFAIQQSDFSLLHHWNHSTAEFILALLPFFWLTSLVLALLLAMNGLRHSRKGYKFSLSRLLGFSTALSLVLGTMLFIGGIAEPFERTFDLTFEAYQGVQDHKIAMWSKPEEGLLCGTVLESSGGELKIEDFSGKSWVIQYPNAFIPPVVQLLPGEQLKFIGEQTDNGQFEAEEIRPWGGPGMRNRKHNRK